MKVFSAAEVAAHNTAESCWVILYGEVYDVTNFLSSHPGGSKIILQLAGSDATEEYDPVHPPGTLAENLPPEAKVGRVDAASLPQNTALPASTSDLNTITDVSELLNIDEIETEATKRISRKAWAYYYSASDDLFSKRLNSRAYQSVLLRPRIFVDCTNCSTATSFLGHPVRTPIYVAPAAMARLAHDSGEAGIAAACASFGACQIISQNASQTPEQIVSAAMPSQIFGWQLYVQADRRKSEAMLARIGALKSIKFLVLTLDAPVPGKREDDERAKNIGGNTPRAAVNSSPSGSSGPSSGGLGASLFWGTAADLTWRTTMPWLVRHTQLPIVIKGVQTHEDAALALSYPAVKGIILSNHGGRALDTAPPALHTLLEIRKYCPQVFEQLEIFVDGGIRRGTDVVKALCLGARGVGIGRAALWGLGAGGIQGVERTFEILQGELTTAMKLLGASNISELGLQHVNTRAIERDLYIEAVEPQTTGLWKAKL